MTKSDHAKRDLVVGQPSHRAALPMNVTPMPSTISPLHESPVLVKTSPSPPERTKTSARTAVGPAPTDHLISAGQIERANGLSAHQPDEEGDQLPPELSIVVPAYNEQDVLPLFHSCLQGVLDRIGISFEILYVNDGSTDATLRILEELAAEHSSVAVLNLSRNFGKELAVTAGLDFACGRAVVVIDADLQDPPELIIDFVAAWRDGFDMVYGQRQTRQGESWLKRKTADGFYRLMSNVGQVQLPPNVGDFRLMSRRVVDALLQLREHHRFMKGLFAWVGFPAKAILYDRNPRAAGKTKWNYWKLWNFALEGITSHTVMPLKLATYLGLTVAVCAVLYGIGLVLLTLLVGNPVPGYPSLIVVVLFLGGVQLFTLGVMGEYLGRVFNEVKQRPLYLVERYTAPGSSPQTASHEALPIR